MTTLQELHAERGANFSDFAGSRLPADFGDPTAEYRAATTAAALFDTSHAGKLEVSGPDAPKFLTNLSTNDLRDLPLGGGCETYFLDHKAKTLFAAWAYHVLVEGAKHAIWLETTAGRGAKFFKHLDRYLISEAVELADVTEQFAQFHLAGPKAKNVLDAALGEALPDLAEFQHLERSFGRTGNCSIRRHDRLGLPGWDLVCRSVHAGGIWQMLTAAGATAAGLNTFETLRIEAATPVYGVDIDEGRFVMEIARVERAVNYAKGCFIGQEPIIMARDRAGFVNRAFSMVKVRGGEPLPAGTKLLRDGQEVGVVTSSAVSPRFGGPVALGYLRRGHQDVGLQLEAMTPAGPVPVEVLGLPANP
ncbi:glycine cleavage T C-terminal barrel domain-containing protein [Limnoglobus roseus]|uniref:Aminomethyl transferase family protein n=1 Tax=Limnoglobus roseus TaxID=2598579 RepID=A0A5C1AJD6_9BACT|nr:glycine cleavage T C-terminal barrel domain-containing protein [Limnoglobus roseus]QEL18116.1 aminomethyl transferase family protein [Limnoglobus roseus]